MATEYKNYLLPAISDYSSSLPKTDEQMEAVLDKMAEQLKRQGVDIEVCQRYLDSVVDKYIAERMYAIDQEHRTNLERIGFAYRHSISEKDAIKRMISLLDEKIKETEKEYEYVQKLYRNQNPLQYGRLKAEGVSSEQNGGT